MRDFAILSFSFVINFAIQRIPYANVLTNRIMLITQIINTKLIHLKDN